METDNNYLAESIAEIKQLVTGLIVLNKSLKDRLYVLEKKREQEVIEYQSIETKYSRSQEEFEAFKMAKVLSEEDKNKARGEVADLMREIDNCIALVKKI